MAEFKSWLQVTRPHPQRYVFRIDESESTVMATSLTDTDIITYENNTSNNIDTFIKREIRRITTNSVQDRKHPMFAVPPLPQSAPWANDPEAMYNADPLFCSGNFHEEMDRLQSVRSGINVKGWISGHRLHTVHAVHSFEQTGCKPTHHGRNSFLDTRRRWTQLATVSDASHT